MAAARVFERDERQVQGGISMQRGARRALVSALCGLVALLCASVGSEASSTKIALIPGGPHPYFAPWEQAAADAKRDFGIASVDYKVPTEWKLNLQTELIESLMSQ